MEKQDEISTFLSKRDPLVVKDLTNNIVARALLTDVNGNAIFYAIPATSSITGTTSKSGFIAQSWSLPGTPSGNTVKMVYLSSTVIVIPTTPIPVTYDTLTLTATPESINLGASVSLTGSASNVTKVTYAGGLRRVVFSVNKHASAYPFDYNPIGIFENVNATHWKFRTSYSSAWGTASTASPLTMTNTPDTNGVYTYAFIGYTDATGSSAISTAATAPVTISGGAGVGSLTMVLMALDGKTTGHLMNYQMNLTDNNNGAITEFGTVSYDKEITLPRGNSYTLKASKENYQDGSHTFVVPISTSITDGSFGAIEFVDLFPVNWLSAGNTSVSVRVYDKETYYPLSTVQISITGYPVQYTGTDGAAASFNIPQSTAYTIVASKTGYCPVTESKNTGTNPYQLVSIFMKYGACTGTTPTPTPTLTITPTITPAGWNNATVSTCGILGTGATFVDVLKNSLACNGFTDAKSQGLGLACLLILFCAIILGRIASGIGVLSGVIVGTVLSTVMGFLPLWVIIIVIILAGLVFAAKIFWSGGQ